MSKRWEAHRRGSSIPRLGVAALRWRLCFPITGFGKSHETVAREREKSDPPVHTIMQIQMAVRWCILAALLLAVTFVPFVVYEESITAAVESYVRSDQPLVAIAFGTAALLACDVLLPVPSSLVATASGLLMGWPLGTLVTWMGMNVGAFMGYWIGSTAGRRVVRRFVGDDALQRAGVSYEKWGDWSLIVSRAVPVLAEASVVFAGTARMPFGRFATWTGIANAAIALVYAAVGAFALETQTFLLAFGASIALPGIAMWLSRDKKRA